MRHSIPVLPFLRRSAVALLVPALALFALVLPARADSPSLFGLTVNGDDIAYASGTGWTFDSATASNDTVTQTAVATLNSSVTARFFKAEIGIESHYEPEDPWEEPIDDPVDDPVDE